MGSSGGAKPALPYRTFIAYSISFVHTANEVFLSPSPYPLPREERESIVPLPRGRGDNYLIHSKFLFSQE
jgi:hypothetical protein